MKIIECPRDAMQGISQFIPTRDKIEYINKLLKIGFDTIDFGSFVSPRAIPQMADTADVIDGLNKTDSDSKLLAIVANQRGAEQACCYEKIDYLGYPFSISETFQQRNTNAGIAESIQRVKQIQDICISAKKQLVIYISMGFGNPYGDVWSEDIVSYWVSELAALNIRIISLADTVGVASPVDIALLFSTLIAKYPEIEFGAHLHTRPDNWRTKVEAAYQNGCRRFDSAIKGFGGCPMADDELTGNLATENLIDFLNEKTEVPGLNRKLFDEAANHAIRLMA